MSGIGCAQDYIPSVAFVLKIIELLCDLLAVILCGAAPTIEGKSGHKGFFLFVSILALIITTILFVSALLNIKNIIIKNAWPFIEMCWCIFIALFYFIAAIVIATIAKENGTYGGAAFFGFAACITYIADGINEFRNWRNGTGSRSADYASNAPPGGYPTYGPDQTQGGRSQPTY